MYQSIFKVDHVLHATPMYGIERRETRSFRFAVGPPSLVSMSVVLSPMCAKPVPELCTRDAKDTLKDKYI